MLSNIENADDIVLDFKEETQPQTKTFALNFATNTVGGIVDELDALKQSIYFLLNTEADQYIIYPYTYGFKTLDLIGKPSYYVMAVLPDRIKETLLSDDRITDVSDFEFEMNNHTLGVQFTIHTVYGDLATSQANSSYSTQLPSVDISLGEIELRLNMILEIQNELINGGAK